MKTVLEGMVVLQSLPTICTCVCQIMSHRLTEEEGRDNFLHNNVFTLDLPNTPII